MYAVVLDDGRSVQASLRGRLKQQGSPVVIGDRVSVVQGSGARGSGVEDSDVRGSDVRGSDVRGSEAAWTIESVAPRASELVRRGRGGRAPKVLAANLDRVFAVVALVEPPATTELIDRLLVMIESSGMHPLLVLNKLDVPGAHEAATELADLYEAVGYRVLAVSARSSEGLDALRDLVCDGSSALIGPSGVGKSSILNALDPALELRTGGLSGKTATGRHTTVSSRLIPLACGGAVADTPGFSDVALWGVGPGDVAACFPELTEPAETCRFRSCTHLHEPGCGVREALEAGLIPESRFRSYAKLRAAAEEAAER